MGKETQTAILTQEVYRRMSGGAMGKETQTAILTQEVYRRMANTREGTEKQQTRDGILTEFCRKLHRSGYDSSRKQEIITRGLLSYEKIRLRGRDGTGVIHRHAEDTVDERLRKRLMDKTNWFKSKERAEDRTWETPKKGNYRGGLGDLEVLDLKLKYSQKTRQRLTLSPLKSCL